MYIFFRKYRGTDEDEEVPIEYDDPTNCKACQYNARLLFWEKERHDNHRLGVFWDEVEKDNKLRWVGDRRPEHTVQVPDSPFLRGKSLSSNEKLFDLIESGGRKEHTCIQSRMPCNLQFLPFFDAGQRWPSGGSGGFFAKIEVTIVGTVEQNPLGRWQWVIDECIKLPFPPCFHSILGKGLTIDGWFKFEGEKALRKKPVLVEFSPRSKGNLEKCSVKGTTLGVKFRSMMIPVPCTGATIWAVYARLKRLVAFGRNKEWIAEKEKRR